MATDTELRTVYAITGVETLLMREALADLKRRAGVDEPDSFDLSEIDATGAGASDILDAVSTAPFLAGRRTVIVSRTNRLHEDERKKLAGALASVPQTGLLILTFDPPDEDRKATPPSNLVKAVKEVGDVVNCSQPKEPADMLRSRAEGFGVSLGAAAATALVEITGNSISDAVAELEKAALYVGQGGSVTTEVVRTVAIPSREYKVFSLMDEIVAGNLGPALKHLQNLLDTAPKVEEAAMRNVLPQLSRQLKMIWQAKALKGAGISESSPQASRYCPTHHNWPESAGRSDWLVKKTHALAARLSYDQITRMMRCLAETDMRLKGQLASAGPHETIERTLMELTAIAGEGRRKG